MPRKKPLKAPFVVTVSVAAAATFAIACGGKTSGSSSSSGSSGDPVNPPYPASCTPETKPGDPCYSFESSCTAPATSGGNILECSNGAWVIGPEYPTNPPVPYTPCPPTEPRVNDACSTYGQSCLFVDGCADRPKGSPADRSYVCENGAWRRVASYPTPCPAKMPSSGESCALCSDNSHVECSYQIDPGCPPTLTSCDPVKLTWNVSVSSCNPPAPDAGAGGGGNPP